MPDSSFLVSYQREVDKGKLTAVASFSCDPVCGLSTRQSATQVLITYDSKR